MEDLLMELREDSKRLKREIKIIKEKLSSLPMFDFGPEWEELHLSLLNFNQLLYSINQQIRYIKESNSNYGRSRRKKRTVQVKVIK